MWSSYLWLIWTKLIVCQHLITKQDRNMYSNPREVGPPLALSAYPSRTGLKDSKKKMPIHYWTSRTYKVCRRRTFSTKKPNRTFPKPTPEPTMSDEQTNKWKVELMVILNHLHQPYEWNWQTNFLFPLEPSIRQSTPSKVAWNSFLYNPEQSEHVPRSGRTKNAVHLSLFCDHHFEQSPKRAARTDFPFFMERGYVYAVVSPLGDVLSHLA